MYALSDSLNERLLIRYLGGYRPSMPRQSLQLLDTFVSHSIIYFSSHINLTPSKSARSIPGTVLPHLFLTTRFRSTCMEGC
jgi:hypothetical protein